jgi:hypothetical protein
VTAKVALREGLLELVACTPDTKEHESIVTVMAKPSHIHAALLLLGARPGRPATVEVLDPDEPRFRHLPPSGSPVDVFLVLPGADGRESQHPINEFIAPSEEQWDAGGDDEEEDDDAKFPTHTFLFAGSVLIPAEDGPGNYLCDQNGNVISLATFGDELLCLPGFHAQANEALAWQVEGTKLPAEGTEVILRLRPQRKPPPAPRPPAPARPESTDPDPPSGGTGA